MRWPGWPRSPPGPTRARSGRRVVRDGQSGSNDRRGMLGHILDSWGVPVYPPRFDYVAPESVGDAISTLAEYGDDAKLLAGGQSLIPLLKLRFASPRILVDLNRISELEGLSQENGYLRIGALVRHKDC